MTSLNGQPHIPNNELKIRAVLVLLSILALGFYSYLLINFVANDSLSSFATDSANYVVMARFLSPWHSATTAVVSAWPAQDFPVFFPLVLALSGAAYDYYLAHAVTVIFLILSIPVIYILMQRLSQSRISAAVIVILFAVCPATWVNSLGILSENLYILLTIISLWLYQRLDYHNKVQLCAFGLLLAVVVLTRTIGISLLAAYSLLVLQKFYKNKAEKIRSLLPAVIAITVIAAAQVFHHTTVPDQYIDQMLGLMDGSEKKMEQGFNLLQQLKALVDAWFVSWMYYWNNQLAIAYLFFCALGVLALAGLGQRLLKMELDAMYLAIYLLILLLWPHPGQSARFLYPVLFLLLLNACYAGQSLLSLFRPKSRFYLTSLLTLLALFSTLPAQSYTYHRYQLGSELGCQFYKEFYTLPDLKEARQQCAMQSVMHADLMALKEITKANDRIMYFIPAYVALLAERVAVPIRFGKDEEGKIVLLKDKQAEYVYLSELHPRKTRKEINGLAVAPFFEGWTSLVRTSYSEELGRTVAVLLKTE